MDTAIVIAVIAAIASVVAATISGFFAARNRKLAAKEAITKSELDARREYRTEALKRLYNSYEPLRFHMANAAEEALSRIQILFESACKGTLIADDSREYYRKATIYHLLTPCVIVRLMERRLTLVDLGLDPKTHAEYILGKALLRSFAEDEHFAKLGPSPLEYSPYVKGWQEKRKRNPQVYRRQGLPLGRLENTLDALTIQQNEGEGKIETLISFGEFERLFERTPESDVKGSIGAPRDLFFQPHPFIRPVLWRILMFQVVIYRALLELTERNSLPESRTMLEMLDQIAKDCLPGFQHTEDQNLVQRTLKRRSIVGAIAYGAHYFIPGMEYRQREAEPESITKVVASIPDVTETVRLYIKDHLGPSLGRIDKHPGESLQSSSHWPWSAGRRWRSGPGRQRRPAA
jgi:hypothetical protein